MTTVSFPPLRAAVLHGLSGLKEAYDADPSILDESPYDQEAKDVLAKIFKPHEVVKEVTKEVNKNGRGRPSKDVQLSAEDLDFVKTELKAVQEELNNLGKQEGIKPNEMVQALKTKASLVEQLLKMQERVFNVKQMSEFQTTVIGILEDLVGEAERELFLARIEPYRN